MFPDVNGTGKSRFLRALALLIVALPLGACAGKANNDTYSLSSVPSVQGPAATSKQILVPEPTALKALDSDQIVIRLSGSELQYLAKSQWGDRLPRMVQSKLVQAFENTGKVGGVGKPGEGLAIDYQIVTEIRAFEVDTTGSRTAVVEIFAKIVNDRNGTVRAQKAFRATVPVSGTEPSAYIKGLDGAAAEVVADIVRWTLTAI
ncbi:ABC transporter [Rhizobium sp. Leaf384]|uniref:ABC-type transport auxiliary lipoprotein family protein n=1 Tax=unclassified Rhizobium TaxID=2613769 RepID=UPI0007163AF1|nr:MULTISPECIES: ABC-type transport auxiliary lipoprotein family protein [unclassified Rhizobium]KQR68792.1 ABC transporter [Rhizobium sp. Leaf341]KQS79202.1 ABC transporter [Rhizobium sp. Leaf384]KQS82771.1 ABC transporter [Rhizobium sp. Leaf383]